MNVITKYTINKGSPLSTRTQIQDKGSLFKKNWLWGRGKKQEGSFSETIRIYDKMVNLQYDGYYWNPNERQRCNKCFPSTYQPDTSVNNTWGRLYFVKRFVMKNLLKIFVRLCDHVDLIPARASQCHTCELKDSKHRCWLKECFEHCGACYLYT